MAYFKRGEGLPKSYRKSRYTHQPSRRPLSRIKKGEALPKHTRPMAAAQRATVDKQGLVRLRGGSTSKKRMSLKDSVAEIKAMQERSRARRAERSSKKPSKRAQTILQRMRNKRKTARRPRRGA